MFLFYLVFALFCARLFICALWSPAGKGLTSWLSFVVSSVSLSLSNYRRPQFEIMKYHRYIYQDVNHSFMM